MQRLTCPCSAAVHGMMVHMSSLWRTKLGRGCDLMTLKTARHLSWAWLSMSKASRSWRRYCCLRELHNIILYSPVAAGGEPDVMFPAKHASLAEHLCVDKAASRESSRESSRASVVGKGSTAAMRHDMHGFVHEVCL